MSLLYYALDSKLTQNLSPKDVLAEVAEILPELGLQLVRRGRKESKKTAQQGPEGASYIQLIDHAENNSFTEHATIRGLIESKRSRLDQNKQHRSKLNDLL